MGHLDNFIRQKCQHCKILNFWLKEDDNTIQACPSCKILAYIKESPTVQPSSLEDDVDGVAG